MVLDKLEKKSKLCGAHQSVSRSEQRRLGGTEHLQRVAATNLPCPRFRFPFPPTVPAHRSRRHHPPPRAALRGAHRRRSSSFLLLLLFMPHLCSFATTPLSTEHSLLSDQSATQGAAAEALCTTDWSCRPHHKLSGASSSSDHAPSHHPFPL
jgi:hypothetical protein